MSGKIEISRELAERLLNFTCNEEYDELRALLATPVVERQEPVAWFGSFGTTGNMHSRVTLDSPEIQKMEAEELKGQGFYMYADIPLYTSPPAPVAVADLDVDQLALIIRTVDGNHSLGAGALAERILDKVKELNQ